MKQMSITDLAKVKNFYDKVIMQQIIKPIEINEILLLVDPDAPTMQPYYKKMRTITVFVQKYQGDTMESLEKYFEETKTIENDPRESTYEHPTVSEDMPPEEQSHYEEITADDIGAAVDEILNEPKSFADEMQEGLDNVIKQLEEEYKTADSNRKRSITMQLKKLKK